jgi:hypothetical protein
MKKQSVLSSVTNPLQSFGGGNPVTGNAVGGGVAAIGNNTVRDQQSSQKIALMTEIVSGLNGVTRVVRMVDVLSEEDLSGMLPAPPALPK